MTDLQKQIEELQLIVISPNVFIENYFNDLTSQLNKAFIKYCIKQNKKANRYFNRKSAAEWKNSLTSSLEEAQSDYISKLTSEYKIERELDNKIWNIVERYEEASGNEQRVSREFEDEVYNCLAQMKMTLLNNECFLVLNEQILSELNSNSNKLWKDIFPILKIKNVYIDESNMNFLTKRSRESIEYLNHEILLISRVGKQLSNEFVLEGNATIPEIDGLVELERLDLSSNQIKVIHKDTFRNFVGLKKIDLRWNKLESIDPSTFDGLVKLEELWLHNNLIKLIHKDTFRNLVGLKRISLIGNNIESIDPSSFNGLVKLEELWLPGNLIKVIHKDTFRNLVSLKKIFLTGNKIESIDPSTFDGLVKLETLCLEFNQIKVIHKDTFRNLVSLKWINLDNNKIESIDPSTFNGLEKLVRKNYI